MVEVFKTNVSNAEDAKEIINIIEKNFNFCQVNFDLDDCDRILRVKSITGDIAADQIIYLLKQKGFKSTVLLDDFAPEVDQIL
ncbi:MAG: hypothetical protein V4546_10170 [Bacteroidota bacterium]